MRCLCVYNLRIKSFKLIISNVSLLFKFRQVVLILLNNFSNNLFQFIFNEIKKKNSKLVFGCIGKVVDDNVAIKPICGYDVIGTRKIGAGFPC